MSLFEKVTHATALMAYAAFIMNAYFISLTIIVNLLTSKKIIRVPFSIRKIAVITIIGGITGLLHEPKTSSLLAVNLR